MNIIDITYKTLKLTIYFEPIDTPDGYDIDLKKVILNPIKIDILECLEDTKEIENLCRGQS